MTPSLTSFEEEVLQAIAHTVTHPELYIYPGSWAWQISQSGQMLFGQGWGGMSVDTGFVGRYPTINRTLGRLAHKELVRREDCNIAQSLGQEWGAWLLTDKGRTLVGLAPHTA